MLSRRFKHLVGSLWVVAAVVALCALAQSNTNQQPAKENKMEQVGKAFVFDYGEFAVRVHYVSTSKLNWEQLKGPTVGLKAEETYHFAEIRPNVYFISWQEKETSVVAQVVDFEGQKVFTTWVSPEKKIAHLEGTIAPAKK